MDVCEPGVTMDKELHRPLIVPTDLRIELHMKNAEEMYRRHGPDVAEIYSQPRVAAEAAVMKFGKRSIKPGWSLDITMPDPEDGMPWDLSKECKRRRLRELINTTEPYFLIGSPPCTPFSNLQNLNAKRRDPEIVKKELEAGKRHIRVCCAEYTAQHKAGKYFVHEHPHTATSWSMPEVQALLKLDGVQVIIVDMCAFGMTATDSDGREGPVKKTTRIVTNSPELAAVINRRCPNGTAATTEEGKHDHFQLIGGRAKQAQVYPRQFW